MTSTPYGGFDANFEHLSDDPWVNLTTINEFLEDGEVIPPDLAQWLGLAIRHSSRDTNEFIRRLGLKQGRGNPNGFSVEIRLDWGERIWRYENVSRTDADGRTLPAMQREEALLEAKKEFEAKYPAYQEGDGDCRSLLQSWRNLYERHRQEAHAK